MTISQKGRKALDIAIADKKISKDLADRIDASAFVPALAGTVDSVGGSADEDYDVPGILDTDVVLVTVKSAGAVPRSIVQAFGSEDMLSISYSGDPDDDHTVAYVVFRAAA